MPDIYGSGKQVYQAGTQVAGAVAKKAGNRAADFFGWSPQAKGVAQNQANATGDAIKYGLEAFGTDIMSKQSSDIDVIIKQIDEDLENLRVSAIQSRREQKLKEYQHYTQLRAMRAEQKAKLKQMQQQRIGEVITGVASAITSVLAPALGYKASIKAAQKPGAKFNVPEPEGWMQRGIYRRNT